MEKQFIRIYQVRKCPDFIVYCIFGFMATLVNMLSYEILYRKLVLHEQVHRIPRERGQEQA